MKPPRPRGSRTCGIVHPCSRFSYCAKQTRAKNPRTKRRCVLNRTADPKMHVRLLKKINVHQFVGQVLKSNAIVRFQTETPLVASEGTLCHVTNCRFDCGAKLVKCQAVNSADASADRLLWPDVATVQPALASGIRQTDGTRTADAVPPRARKRKRVTFSDDEQTCSALC